MSQPAPHPSPRPAPFGGNRALVVDDERALADLVGSYLTRDGFEVSLAHDGRQGIERARQVDPDAMVLDLGLPVVDGVEVCRAVRTFSDRYIVMLTARNEEIDKLIGLSVGADDYVTKPFSPRELMARIHAMLRRPRAATGGGQPSQEEPTRVFGALSVDVAGREVHLDDLEVALTRTEFDVLEALSGDPQWSSHATRRRGLAGRLLVAQTLVPLTGTLTAESNLCWASSSSWRSGSTDMSAPRYGVVLRSPAGHPSHSPPEAGAGNQTWSPDRRRQWVCATP
jgi:DNA-binding response OmpR family regulator